MKNKIINIKTFIIFLILQITPSCKDEQFTDICKSEDSKVNACFSISPDGFLDFPTYQSLEAFFEKIQNGEEITILNKARKEKKFESVAMLNDKISKKRSRDHLANEFIEDDLDDLEEMSIDEYNLMKSEELLFDNLMEHAMDTTLRICVEGKLYKITNEGTFSVNLDKADILDVAIKNFNPELKESIDAGETIQLDTDVQFTNSFKKIKTEEGDLLEYYPELPARTTSNLPANEFHKRYGVDSYKWKNTNVIKRFLDFIRGKDVSKTKNFSKNYRVQVNIFDVNYKFYKSAGIKVKMQKRKKFCFVPYWVETPASKLAIGFNEMEGVLKYENPNNLSIITPTASAKWKSLKGTLNGISCIFIYGVFHNLKFIKDWTDSAAGWMPEVRIGDKNYTTNIINKLYNTPSQLVYSYSKSFINKKVYNIIEETIKPEDPMVAYLYWGKSEFKFDKERPFITGVKEYCNIKSKSVIFDRSFGVSFYGKVPIPYTPSDFDIKSIDAFGAAYYDGKWLGIRFFGK